MYAAGDIARSDVREYMAIVTNELSATTFSHVTIDVN
jgi:hypothetical protein